MRDLKKYWQEVREIERSLPEFVWLTSVECCFQGQVGGSVAEVSASQAAPLLYAKSHRVATEDEVSSYRAREEAHKQRVLSEDLQREGVAIVSVRSGR
jgi:hypothetical protein